MSGRENHIIMSLLGQNSSNWGPNGLSLGLTVWYFLSSWKITRNINMYIEVSEFIRLLDEVHISDLLSVYDK